jgi:uncharacterized protein YdaU (DUF1376 family)
MSRAKLPFYSMYPSDFDVHEAVRGMTDAEVGFFVRCLNHAWMNEGIPADEEELERVIPGKRSEEEFKRIWKRVSRCFVQVGDRLVNPRQEEERAEAKERSKKSREKAEKRWGARDLVPDDAAEDATASDQHLHSNALHNNHHSHTPCSPPVSIPESLDAAFHRLTEAFPNAAGVDMAAQIWINHVESGAITEATVPEVFAGLERWRGSDLWARDDGRYITTLAKWLHKKLWKDSPKQSAAAKAERRAAKTSDGSDPLAEWAPPEWMEDAA